MKNKIALIYSPKTSLQHLESIERLQDILNDRILYSVCSKDLKELNEKETDLVLTVGGDGTFIRTSSFLRETPILGINSEPNGSEGALTTLTADNLNELEKIIDEEKMLLRDRAIITRNGIQMPELALNEVYIGAASQFHTSRYKIRFKNKEEEQRSSGVIVCSGSGSHAWYKSAGGKPFNYDSKEFKFLVREHFFGKLFKPKILKGVIKENETISFKSKSYYGGAIAVDSNKMYKFKFDEVIEISLSKEPLNVVVK